MLPNFPIQASINDSIHFYGQPMKTYCCYTPSHKILFDKHFSPTAPSSMEIHATLIDIKGTGDFQSAGYLECIRRQMDLVIESIRTNLGQLIIWCDVDIVFIRDPQDELVRLAAASNSDLYFQREAHHLPDVNTGFILIRCNEATLAFFQKVKSQMLASPEENDQMVINKMLAGPCDIRWEVLPWSFSAKSHCWPPPSDGFIFHANNTLGKNSVQKKTSLFRDLGWVQRYGPPALFFIKLKKVPSKAAAWIQKAILEPIFPKPNVTP